MHPGQVLYFAANYFATVTLTPPLLDLNVTHAPDVYDKITATRLTAVQLPRLFSMKISPFLLPLAFLASVSFCSAQSLTFGYSNLTSQLIEFAGTGDQITFGANGNAQGFFISDSNLPALLDLKGSIDGVFTIDTANISSGTLFGVTYDEAPVMGTGTLKIFDPSDFALTAQVDWGDVLRVATTGSLNPGAMLNLSNFNYAGTYAPLLALGASQTGSTTVTFQFAQTKTLLDLTQDGASNSATYSGVASTSALIPEPSTYAALMGGAALLGVALSRRMRPVVRA